MQSKLTYNKENREEFFAKIDELTEKDKHTEYINALESIPAEERDYEISYQLARALQNFAIVGDDDKGTEYEIGEEVLLKSLEILESVRKEGQNKAEWNMRMAYGYQYLFHQEEKAIPYALRWAELDPEDKDALEVIKECQEEVEKRKKIREKYAEIEGVVKEEFEIILKEHGIENADVIAKKERAVEYCKLASHWVKSNGYKEWRYLFIPSQEIKENYSLSMIAEKFTVN